jgi:hypothetical protein
MARLGQVHALWVQEGMAAMFEDMAEDAPADADAIVRSAFAPSWRTNMVKRMARRGGIVDLSELVSMPTDRFMGSRRSAHYAEARALMMFLAEREVLDEWYRAYIEQFATDPTGATALCAALAKPDLDSVQQDFEAWLDALPEVSELGSPRGATLGVVLDEGKGDGPVVGEIVAGRVAGPPGADGEERLRYRDVMLAVEGVPTPTLDDLYRVLGHFRPGDAVEVLVRRGRRDLTVRALLVDPDTRP